MMMRLAARVIELFLGALVALVSLAAGWGMLVLFMTCTK